MRVAGRACVPFAPLASSYRSSAARHRLLPTNRAPTRVPWGERRGNETLALDPAPPLRAREPRARLVGLETALSRQNRSAGRRFWLMLAEGEGFEPSKDRKALNGFRDRPVQPLRHPSKAPASVGSLRVTGRAAWCCRCEASPADRQRRDAKKLRSNDADSSARSPPATSGRWLSRASPSTSSTLPAAPALGSAAP